MKESWMEEIIEDPMRMFSKTWLEAAHFVKACTLKSAHRKIFKAFQL